MCEDSSISTSFLYIYFFYCHSTGCGVVSHVILITIFLMASDEKFLMFIIHFFGIYSNLLPTF